MSTFDSTKTKLSDLLEDIVDGKLRLPDFQRGWVWDDSHIRSLLVSVARSFPIGAIMLLETGGEARFQERLIEGVPEGPKQQVENLVLDGQQRLTSLTQVLKLTNPVRTKDEQKRDIKRFYYFNIEKVLEDSNDLADTLIAVDENKILKTNFGRDVLLDLSTPAKEVGSFYFPCNQILNSDSWEEQLHATHPDRFSRHMEFRKRVLNTFRSYLVPVIVLNKATSKEAVCLVFEKVNTGGVSLSVFELVTATYAADNFNLRTDWYGGDSGQGRRARFNERPLLREVEPTDFLQGVSLLHTYDKRKADLAVGKSGKDATAVSAKREHILVTPLSAYKDWAEQLSDGFLETERFLRHMGFFSPKYLPYRAQLVPLAGVLSQLRERWLEPTMQRKLTQWFWCGVFGELYGGANETRIALDLQDLFNWISDGASFQPATVVAAGFQASRLDTLRTRTSAAYRGLYVLLQQHGARDFFWKSRITELDRDERGIDIHHIFPKKWCETKGISPRIYNSIVNKTAISYKANRKIGGNSPSEYLSQLQKDPAVQLDDAGMNEILVTHLIDPDLLRRNDFEAFYDSRRRSLVRLVEAAMAKPSIVGADAVPDDAEGEDEE